MSRDIGEHWHLVAEGTKVCANKGPAQLRHLSSADHGYDSSFGHQSASRRHRIINITIEAPERCDFNMVAELPIATYNTTASGMTTTTTAAAVAADTTAAVTATGFMMIIITLSAAAYIIIRYIILTQRDRADLATAQCPTHIQNKNLKLLPFCLMCNDNDCIYEITSAENPPCLHHQ